MNISDIEKTYYSNELESVDILWSGYNFSNEIKLDSILSGKVDIFQYDLDPMFFLISLNKTDELITLLNNKELDQLLDFKIYVRLVNIIIGSNNIKLLQFLIFKNVLKPIHYKGLIEKLLQSPYATDKNMNILLYKNFMINPEYGKLLDEDIQKQIISNIGAAQVVLINMDKNE